MAATLQGLLASPQRLCTGASTSRSACKASPVAHKLASPHRHARTERNCAAASCSSHCESSVDELSKYERILRFVEGAQVQPVAHVAHTVATGDCGDLQLGDADSSWYHSYDEEAEEGCSDSDEQQDAYLLESATTMNSACCSTSRSGGRASSSSEGSDGIWQAAPSNSVYASAYYRARLSSLEAQFADVAPAQPCHYAAVAGATEDSAWAAATGTSAAAAQQEAARADRRARRIRRARRAAAATTAATAAAAPSTRYGRYTLRADYGPLERCEPWVDPAATAYAAAATAAGGAAARRRQGARYGTVLAHKLAYVRRRAVKPLAGGIEEVLARLRAADKRLGEFRAPQAWHLTFDEDVHGSFEEASVMASC